MADKKIILGGISERLRSMRKDTGLTVRAFAQKYDVDPSLFSLLENAKKDVRISTLADLCEKLDMAPTYLLFGFGPKSKTSIENGVLLARFAHLDQTLPPGRIQKLYNELLKIEADDDGEKTAGSPGGKSQIIQKGPGHPEDKSRQKKKAGNDR